MPEKTITVTLTEKQVRQWLKDRHSGVEFAINDAIRAALATPSQEQPRSDWFYLCFDCGTISHIDDWSWWQRNDEDESEGAPEYRPSRPDETDPLAKCPRCGEMHGDCYVGAGVEDGTRAQCEAERKKMLEDEGTAEGWAEALAKVPTQPEHPAVPEHALVVTEIPDRNERRYACTGCNAKFMAPLDDVPLPAERECDGCNRFLPTRRAVPEHVGGDGTKTPLKDAVELLKAAVQKCAEASVDRHYIEQKLVEALGEQADDLILFWAVTDDDRYPPQFVGALLAGEAESLPELHDERRATLISGYEEILDDYSDGGKVVEILETRVRAPLPAPDREGERG